MTTTQTTQRWSELQMLDGKVRSARERVDRLEVEKIKAARAVDRALAPLRDYYEQMGAGEREPDARLERELQAAVEDARDMVTMRPRFGRGGEFLNIEPVDERAEAQLAGAHRALDEAQQAIDTFLRRHRDELAAELMPRTVEARDGFEESWRTMRENEREWTTVLQLWARVARSAGIPPDEMPSHPLRGLDPAIDRGVPLPMPAAFLPEEEADAA